MAYRTRLSLGVLLICACVLSLSLIFIVLHMTGPSDGVRLEPDGSVWSRVGIVVTPLEGYPARCSRICDGVPCDATQPRRARMARRGWRAARTASDYPHS